MHMNAFMHSWALSAWLSFLLEIHYIAMDKDYVFDTIVRIPRLTISEGWVEGIELWLRDTHPFALDSGGRGRAGVFHATRWFY
jgi:hypothetical protein